MTVLQVTLSVLDSSFMVFMTVPVRALIADLVVNTSGFIMQLTVDVHPGI